MNLNDELQYLAKERPLNKLTKLIDYQPMAMGSTFAILSNYNLFLDRLNEYISACDQENVYNLRNLGQEDEFISFYNTLDKMGIDDPLLAVEDVSGLAGLVLKYAYIYAIATTSSYAVMDSFMRGKNTKIDTTEYIATMSDNEYVEYMKTEHPMSYAILKANNSFLHQKRKIIVMGYLIKGVDGSK